MNTATRLIPRGRRGVGAALGTTAFGCALALLMSGCSGGTKNAAATGSSTSASVTASTSNSAARADLQQYSACLQQHGLTLPSVRPDASFSRRPRPSGSARPRGTFSRPPGGFGGFLGSADPSAQAALQACASLRPQGAFGGPGAGGRTISATTFAAFKSCMSDNGVTIAQTDAQAALRGLDRSDAKVAAALKICQPILGRSTPTPSPSG